MVTAAVFQDRRPHAVINSLALLLIGVTAAAAGGSSLRRTAVVRAVTGARAAVVNIHGRKVVTDEDRFGDPTSAHQVNGMGTGIVIDERGYVLTNYHVVDGVSRIRVTLFDGTTTVATLLANDARTDLAIIKIPSDEPMTVIPMGTSVDLMAGETVIAVGNAFGYEHTVTRGIISALHRTVQVSDSQKYHDLIQTDASINPGNSGGPLLNIDGQMIGINVAVRVGAQGIGFAIPIDEAMDVAATLIASDRMRHVEHGIVAKTDASAEESQVVVQSSTPDSPADEAGLLRGDEVLRVDGRDIARRLDIERALIDHQAGESIAIQVRRNGQLVKLNLMLGKAVASKPSLADMAWRRIGLRLQTVPTSVFRRYRSRYRGGMKVTDVRAGSPAAEQGIVRGDVLVGLHKWETISPDNINYILNSSEFGAVQPFKFYILRGGETLFGHMRLASSR